MKSRHSLLRGKTLTACAAVALLATASLVQAQKPEVIITSPEPNEEVLSSSVNVVLSAKANVGELVFINVRMDDRPYVKATPMAYTNEDGYIAYSVLFEDLADTNHTVKAFPKDTFGNFGSDRIDFTVKTDLPDTEPPTVPANLRVIGKTDTSIALEWDASFDNVGATRYKVSSRDLPDQYRVGNVTTCVIPDLSPDTSYRFKIKAYDAANNFSVYSPETIGTTEMEGFDSLITFPTNGASIGAGDVALSVNAPEGTDSVTFSINGYEVATTNVAPFGYTFNNLQGGTYTLTAVANHDGLTTTDSVTITVDPTLIAGQFNFLRINNEAIISRQSFFDVGANRIIKAGSSEYEWDNINGPHAIRIPDWIDPQDRAHTNAMYYCYFSHHHGKCIRLAWAENIEGPWTLYNMEEEVAYEDRGVLSFDNHGSNAPEDQLLDIGNGLFVQGHMASPDIFVDDANEQIVMFFHGPYWHDKYNDGNLDDPLGQVSFTAASTNGLSFKDNVGSAIIAKSYLGTFWYDGELYGLDSSGTAYHHRDPYDNLLEPMPGTGFDYGSFYWEQNDVKTIQHKIRPEYVRHIKPLVVGDTLFASYSATRGTPEQLYYVTVDLTEPDWRNWEQQPTFNSPEVFKLATAEAGWEGGHFLPLESVGSAKDEGVNQLRDPQFFRDADGEFYMFYVGQGEDAIGVARLQWVD